MPRRHDLIQGLLYGGVFGTAIFGLASRSCEMAMIGALFGAGVGLIPAHRQVSTILGSLFKDARGPAAWSLASQYGSIGFILGLGMGLLFSVIARDLAMVVVGLALGVVLYPVGFVLGALVNAFVYVLARLVR